MTDTAKINARAAAFAKLVEKQNRAEADMRRAFNRWSKVRAQVLRAEKKLEKEFTTRADGTATWGEDGLAVPAELRLAGGPAFDDPL